MKMIEEPRLIELRLIPKVSKSQSVNKISTPENTKHSANNESTKYTYSHRDLKIPAYKFNLNDDLFQNQEASSWESYINSRLKENIFLPPKAEIPDSLTKYSYLLPDLNFMYEPGAGDYVGAELFSKNTGGGMKASSIPPPEIKPEIIEPQFDFVPTPLQVAILSRLFKEPQSTPGEIYPVIPDTLSASIQIIFDELDFLYQKGMVDRKTISPQSPFSLFGMPIEFNSKNKKNINFEYWAKILKEDFLSYLNSDLTTQDTSSKIDSIDTKTIESLRRHLIF